MKSMITACLIATTVLNASLGQAADAETYDENMNIATTPRISIDTSSFHKCPRSRSPLLTELKLRITENGELSEVSVAQSSGRPKLDQDLIAYIEAEPGTHTPGIIRGRYRAMDYNVVAKCADRRLILDRDLATENREHLHIVDLGLEEQRRDLEQRKRTYAKEAPYRIFKTERISNEEMAVRVFQGIRRMTYCGDSAFKQRDDIVQYKGFWVRLSAVHPVSEVERLNGVEWKGTVKYGSKFARMVRYDAWGKMDEWVEGETMSELLWKKNGQWLDQIDAHAPEFEIALTCDELSSRGVSF